jgi:UDP-N-acetylmuramyl pentapeptide phosphotransferase/UDP-N-acetylglucosamine-1-phosphate transferase
MVGGIHVSSGWAHALKYVAAFAFPLVLSLLLTPVVRWLCLRAGMVDQPGSRRIHDRPIARGGGVAIFLAFHAACAVWFLGRPDLSLAGLTGAWWMAFLPPSILLLLVGVADDRFGLRPTWKLLGQIAAVGLATALGLRIHSVLWWQLPVWVDIPLTVLVCVAVINAFNLIDGMDGLASGLAAVAALGLAGAFILQRVPGSAMLVLALAGAAAGFLVYNFHPASVFLGDSGSMFLGFTLVSVALTTGNKSTAAATLGIPLLAFGVPVLDTLLAIWRRSIRKRILKDNGGAAMSRGDLDHLHHRLARRGLTQRRVAGLLYLTNAAAIAAGIAMMVWSQVAVSIFLVAFVVGAYVVFRHYAGVEMTESGRLLAAGLRRPAKRSLPVLLYPAIDFAVLSVAMTLGIEPHLESASNGFREQWLACFPFLVCVPFLALASAGTYRRVWSRARVSEFAGTGIALAGGVTIGAALLNLVVPLQTHDLVACIVVVAGLGGPALLGIRALPRLVQDVLGWTRRQRLASDPAAHRVLVYGAGYGYTLLMRYEAFEHPDREAPHIVVGLIDDDRNLRGRVVYGHPVLGGVDDLPRIVAEQKVDELIVSTLLSDAKLARVLDTAASAGVEVCQWVAGLHQVAAGRRCAAATGPQTFPPPGFVLPAPAPAELPALATMFAGDARPPPLG